MQYGFLKSVLREIIAKIDKKAIQFEQKVVKFIIAVNCPVFRDGFAVNNVN